MTESAAITWRNRLAQRRFAVLLAALVALLLIGPLIGDDPRGEADMALFFSAVVLGFASAARRVGLAMGLAAIWLILIWIQPFGDGPVGSLLVDLALIAICAAAIDSALRLVLRATIVDDEVLFAAVSVYVLMGVAWAAAYSIMATLQPGALSLSPEDAERPWQALLYFSFVTLTTLGYGDVLPVSSVARAWAMVEAAAGTIYLAILIARLVNSYRSGSEQQADGRSDAAPDGPAKR